MRYSVEQNIMFDNEQKAVCKSLQSVRLRVILSSCALVNVLAPYSSNL